MDPKTSLKLIDLLTSFKLRPNKHLDFVNPTIANLRDVRNMAWESLHGIDHNSWPWRWPSFMSQRSAIDSDNIIWNKPNNQHLDFVKYENCWILRDVW